MLLWIFFLIMSPILSEHGLNRFEGPCRDLFPFPKTIIFSFMNIFNSSCKKLFRCVTECKKPFLRQCAKEFRANMLDTCDHSFMFIKLFRKFACGRVAEGNTGRAQVEEMETFFQEE